MICRLVVKYRMCSDKLNTENNMFSIQYLPMYSFSFPLKGHPPKTNGNGSSGGIIENPVELR